MVTRSFMGIMITTCYLTILWDTPRNIWTMEIIIYIIVKWFSNLGITTNVLMEESQSFLNLF